MTKNEAQRQIDHASNRVSQLVGELRQARQIDHASSRVSQLVGELRQARLRLAEMVDRVGLAALGISRGDVIVLDGKRYSVTGARYRYGQIEPRGLMIKKDGTVGERELPTYCRGWERENAD